MGVTDIARVRPALIYLFAKEPLPGLVKTRLSPQLEPRQAARCQRAFISDLVERVGRVPGVELVLAATPDYAAPWLATLSRRTGTPLVWQGEGDLGARMARTLAAACRKNRTGVILGADIPDLPLAWVSEALAALSGPGTVIGPAADGGYYLIGCCGEVPPVFRLEAAWGGPGVFEETLARLHEMGQRVHVLPRWEDVDDHASLCRLALRLAQRAPAGDRPIHTVRLLRTLAAEGVAL